MNMELIVKKFSPNRTCLPGRWLALVVVLTLSWSPLSAAPDEREPESVTPASTEENNRDGKGPDQPAPADAAFGGGEEKDTGYLFSGQTITGGGGGPFFMYASSSYWKDSLISGGRGYALVNDDFRFGGMGMGMVPTASGNRSGAGFGGLWLQYLSRQDPFIFGFGLTTGAGGFGEEAASGKESGPAYAYFVAYPHLELELRLLKWMSFSLTGGYSFWVPADSAAPKLSNAAIGFAFTFGKF